jgi:hypothetical protein
MVAHHDEHRTLSDPAVAHDLDRLLFRQTGWFAICVRNRRVPGVLPGTLTAALGLIGRGDVASIVGRLRPEVAGIDIDAPGSPGDLAMNAVRDWCRAHGLWHLIRASGGGPGRWHVFVVAGVWRERLEQWVIDVRREQGLTVAALGVRQDLRPLSAPHRRTGHLSPLPADHSALLSDLRSILDAAPTQPAQKSFRPRAARTALRPTTLLTPLTPLPRPRRAVPPGWAAYLSEGRRAAAAAGLDRDPNTRSQIELEATFQLVIAGLSEDQAWQRVKQSHRTAFTKAKTSGRRWWWWQWNRCVTDADAWLTERRRETTQRSPGPVVTSTKIQAAHQVMDAHWRSWPARTRHTDHEVLGVILTRMARVASANVVIPQRDLVLDCAIASRTTVRAALRRLQARGLLEIRPTYQPGSTDTAHTLRLPAQIPFPQETRDQALSMNVPSRFHPPLHYRRALGLRCAAVLTHLLAITRPQGSTLYSVAAGAGLLEDCAAGDLTPAQRRTVTAHLLTLVSHGLATVDEHGLWRATETTISQRADQVGTQLSQHVQARIAAERSEFRSRFDPQARRARWEHQRDTAIARSAKAARTTQKAWWDRLDQAERQSRRDTSAARFARATPAQQTSLKTQWAKHRRAADEPNERTRHTAWLASLTDVELDQRSIDRARAWKQRPTEQQQALVSAWTVYRARWDLPKYRPARAPHPRRRLPTMTN